MLPRARLKVKQVKLLQWGFVFESIRHVTTTRYTNGRASSYMSLTALFTQSSPIIPNRYTEQNKFYANSG